MRHTTTFGNTIKLLRIPFSLFLMPVFLLAISQIRDFDTARAWWAFFIIHLLVYPSSNGYNSYIDRDETPIGGLLRPPKPTLALLYTTIGLDILAVLLAFFAVKPLFAACIVAYIAASRAYSSPQIRLKKYPFWGFAVVVFFQGAFTYYMTNVGASQTPFAWQLPHIYILLAASLQIAGAYPLTQIYQHEADQKDGVTTLSYVLGYRGTFIFCGICLLLCNVFYFLYFSNIGLITHFYWLQIILLPTILYFARWFWQVHRDTAAANFKRTMLMNALSSLSMSLFAILLILCQR